MLINGVDMNIKLTRAPDVYLLAHKYDNKVFIKILHATLFITQVELKAPLLVLVNVLVMKRKAHCPVTHTQIKTLLRILGPSRSLSIMNYLDQFQNRF
jgi:hypothetical protein